jgi:hypothetical protein
VPAYYSVGFQYERATVRPGFLRDLYSAMLRGEFAYGGVLAWGCRGDLTLDEVINWNQERLDRDFELGYREHVSKNCPSSGLKGSTNTGARRLCKT